MIFRFLINDCQEIVKKKTKILKNCLTPHRKLRYTMLGASLDYIIEVLFSHGNNLREEENDKYC